MTARNLSTYFFIYALKLIFFISTAISVPYHGENHAAKIADIKEQRGKLKKGGRLNY